MVVDNGGKGHEWCSVFCTGGNGQGPRDGGALIELTASASEISDYGDYYPFGKPIQSPFMAFTSAFPSSAIPRKVLGGCDPVLCADDPQELHAFQEEDDLLRRNGRIGESA